LTRLLIYLAAFAIAVMILAAVLGLRLGDLRAAKAEFDRNQGELASLEVRSGDAGRIDVLRQRQAALAEQIRSVDSHWLVGVGAAIAVLFANSIAVTYFIGTNRWCKEVVDAYSLDRAYVVESTALKRRAFPWGLLGMLSVIGVAFVGGLADPRISVAAGIDWPRLHFLAALAAIALVALAFYMQWTHVVSHHALIGRVMNDVSRIRTERGLPVYDEARK
jgi:hypothetical protein